jgi:hypothetical protein
MAKIEYDELASIIRGLGIEAMKFATECRAHPDDLSQNIEARRNLPRALVFLAEMLANLPEPPDRDALTTFLTTFRLGADSLNDLAWQWHSMEDFLAED